MFDLKIQTAEKPTFNATPPGKILRGFDLMYRPRILHRAGILQRQRELGLFNAMSKLKNNAYNQSCNTDCQNVEQEHHPEGMDQKRQSKRQCKEQSLTANKAGEFPPFRPCHTRGSDPAKDYVAKIIVEMPLDHIQSVERPQIEMLPAMNSKSFLMWCQPAEKRDINIGIMARNVYIGMMYNNVFPVAYIRTGANQIHRHGCQPVDPGMI